MSNLSTINSFVRTCLLLGFLGVVGYAGWFGYERYVKPGLQAEAALAEAAQLKAELAASLEKQSQLMIENDRMQTSLKLLKTDRRIANVEILDKSIDDEGSPEMLVRFTEVDEYGEAVGSSKDYTLKGDQFFIDCWIATFDDKYVEQADELRNASLFAFKSIYGDAEKPRDAQRLDSDSIEAPPGIYDDDRKRDFEQQIWSDFWSVCNDRARQEELGIRAAYGQANHLVGEAGQRYQVEIPTHEKSPIFPYERSDSKFHQADASAIDFLNQDYCPGAAPGATLLPVRKRQRTPKSPVSWKKREFELVVTDWMNSGSMSACPQSVTSSMAGIVG